LAVGVGVGLHAAAGLAIPASPMPISAMMLRVLILRIMTPEIRR
jgi:hypothetical protein